MKKRTTPVREVEQCMTLCAAPVWLNAKEKIVHRQKYPAESRPNYLGARGQASIKRNWKETDHLQIVGRAGKKMME